MDDFQHTGTELVWPGKYNQKGKLNTPPLTRLPFRVVERNDRPSGNSREPSQKPLPFVDPRPEVPKDPAWRNKLAWGDNLPIMFSWLAEFRGCVDLVYIDPPFATGADFSIKYRSDRDGVLQRVNFWDSKNDSRRSKSTASEMAYRDKWDRGIGTYLGMVHPRLMLIHKLLSSEGHLFVHCDWRVNSYLRILLDEIFSPECFKSEIIWQRSKISGRVADPKKFDMLSDSILFYSKTPDAKINKPKIKRSYTPQDAKKIFKYDAVRKAFYKDSPCGNYSESTIQRLDLEGRIYWTSKGKPRVKTYLASETTDQVEKIVDETQVGNVWTDILGMMHVGKHEMTGYPTQKPESLLERIILAGSREGSLVADFFCGSGTTLIAAQKQGRRWLGCDVGQSAIHITRKRLLHLGTESCGDKEKPAFFPFEILVLDSPEKKQQKDTTPDQVIRWEIEAG